MATETKTNNEVKAVPAPQPAQVISVAIQQPAANQTNGLAIASMVTGIFSVLTSFFAIGFIAGVVALVLGIVGVKKPTGKGMAIAGIATGSAAILITSILFMIGFMIGFVQGISGY